MHLTEDDRIGDEFTLRIFVRCDEAAPELRDTKLFKVCRGVNKRDLHIYLPDKEKMAATGWVPEVVYGLKDTGEIVDVFVSPKWVPLPHQVKQDLGLRDSVRATLNSSEDKINVSAADTANLHQPDKAPHTESPRSAPAQDEILYRATLENREIKVNGFRLSRPNFNSENEVVFDYLMKNPNRKIELVEIESAVGRPLTKKLREIIRDLGFKRELKELFFPGISKTAIEFVNPITQSDFEARKLRSPCIEIRE